VKEDDDSLGERFKKKRLTKYKSREEFSVVMDCSREYISKIENNKSDLTLSFLKESAEKLNMPTWQLVKYLLNE
jgi:transcriptional regulator with XRE-family HTH domain